MTVDSHIDRIRAEVEPGEWSAYVRAAIIEKHARDKQRGELDDVQTRLAVIEQHLGIEP